MPPRERARFTPKDIADLDAEEYHEPGRDLMSTLPNEAGEHGGGPGGDTDNPRAERGVPGSIGHTQNKFGSDEHNKLAKGRNA